MSVRWLLDSNTVIYMMQSGSTSEFIANTHRCVAEGAAVSIITRIEVLGWRGHTPQSRAAAERALEKLYCIGLGEDVVKHTIAIRSQHAIKLPDAIIAASALAASLTLVTRNLRDFAGIDGLQVQDPFTAIA